MNRHITFLTCDCVSLFPFHGRCSTKKSSDAPRREKKTKRRVETVG